MLQIVRASEIQKTSLFCTIRTVRNNGAFNQMRSYRNISIALGALSLMTVDSASASTVEGEYWSNRESGWHVIEQTQPNGTGTGCYAFKSFASPALPNVSVRWVFAHQPDGRWFALVEGTHAQRLVGRRVGLVVDGAVAYTSQPTLGRSNSAHLGGLSGHALREIADGLSMELISDAGRSRFPLDGTRDALRMTAECVAALPAGPVVASVAPTAQPDGAVASPRATVPAEVSRIEPQTAPQQVIRSVPPVVHPIAVTPTAPVTASPSAEPKLIGTGSGFYVSAKGHVATNAHVVSGCTAVMAKDSEGVVHAAKVVALDKVNDVALLQLPPPTDVATVLPWRFGVRVGQAISVYGFPLFGTLSKQGVFTQGQVSSLAGIDNAAGNFQISAPIQPGNSGGPVTDDQGYIVGIAASKLNELKFAAAGTGLPQNVNFAVKSTVAASLLEANGVVTASVGPNTAPLKGEELAERLKAASLVLGCFGH